MLTAAITIFRGIKQDSTDESKQLRIVRLLIAHNADPNKSGDNGYRPLHGARTPRIATALIEAKADVDAEASGKYTPLMMACYHGLVGVARVLLEHDAKTQLINERGETAIDITPGPARATDNEQCKELIRAHIANQKATSLRSLQARLDEAQTENKQMAEKVLFSSRVRSLCVTSVC